MVDIQIVSCPICQKILRIIRKRRPNPEMCPRCGKPKTGKLIIVR